MTSSIAIQDVLEGIGLDGYRVRRSVHATFLLMTMVRLMMMRSMDSRSCDRPLPIPLLAQSLRALLDHPTTAGRPNAALRNLRARAKVQARIKRLSSGNPGDIKPVGAGVSELALGSLQNMKDLPPSAASYKRTPIFEESTTPSGLLSSHSTKTGVWGRIVVLKVASSTVSWSRSLKKSSWGRSKLE